MSYPMATIQMENGAVIRIRLRPDQAPNTVASFLHLAQLGCYDGHAIERIVPGYVADMSYRAFGQAACKYLIANESRSHGVENTLKIAPGVVAMGGYGENGIAGGEFFFPFAYHEKLDGNYPGFGEVLEGWEEIDRWQTIPTRPVRLQGSPIEINEPCPPLVIRSVTVETFGESYPPPVLLPVQNLPSCWD